MFSSLSLLSRRVVFAVALAVISWLGTTVSHAQIQVELKLSRHTYILYEPMIATVTITNNTGRDITLADEEGKQWFNVEINHVGDMMISPFNPDYQLHPLTIPEGQSLQRKIDLTPLFPIRESGTHKVRANVYFAEMDRYFYSNSTTFDLTDGKLLWRESVGVPGSTEDIRQVSLLTHQLPDRQLLYVRVRDENGNNIYTTQSLGRLITTGHEPQEMFDRDNVLHVLHEAIAGTYLYSIINLNGERTDQKVYLRAGPSRPMLVKSQGGEVSVRGGQAQAVRPEGIGAAAEGSGAKLSDRPRGLPLAPQR